MATYRELLAQTKAEIDEVDVPRLATRLGEEAKPALVDVRERDEWDEGHIPGAVHVPRGNLESRIEQAVPDRTMPSSSTARAAPGRRSPPGRCSELGYENVASLAGGFTEWKRSGQPFDIPRGAQPRAARPLQPSSAHPEVGEEGQLKLLDSRVLLLGAGGLGSPAALYLAAAG